MPAIARPRATLAQPSRDRGTELQHPAPDRFVGNVEPSLGQQLLDIAVAQREAEIEPDRVLDDLGREAVAAVAVAERSHADIIPDTPPAPDPVSVTMPSVEFNGYADLALGDRVEPVLEVTWVGNSKMEMGTRFFPRDAGQPCRLTRRDGARPPVVEGKHEEIDENRGGCFPWRGFCARYPDGADIRPRAEQQHGDDGAATTQTFASAYAPR
jgi:hypothetical protein